MSALGQKQTCAAHKLMSALPPKATSNATYGNVRWAKSRLMPCSKKDRYSITLSARASTLDGNARPSALAATDKSGHVQRNYGCPLWVKSRHMPRNKRCVLYTQ